MGSPVKPIPCLTSLALLFQQHALESIEDECERCAWLGLPPNSLVLSPERYEAVEQSRATAIRCGLQCIERMLRSERDGTLLQLRGTPLLAGDTAGEPTELLLRVALRCVLDPCFASLRGRSELPGLAATGQRVVALIDEAYRAREDAIERDRFFGCLERLLGCERYNLLNGIGSLGLDRCVACCRGRAICPLARLTDSPVLAFAAQMVADFIRSLQLGFITAGWTAVGGVSLYRLGAFSRHSA